MLLLSQQKFKETKMNVEEIARKVLERELTVREGASGILKEIWENKVRLGLSGMSEDEFSSFLIHIHPRIETMLRNFNPKAGPFQSFFLRSLKFQKIAWRREQFSRQALEDGLLLTCAMEREETQELYNIEEASLSVESAEPGGSAGEAIRLLSHAVQSPREIRDRQSQREAILVLALKSAQFITDGMTRRISETTGIPLKKLYGMLDMARESMRKAGERKESFTSSRNEAWLKSRRFMLEKERLGNGSPLYDEYCARYEFYRERWSRTNRKISRSFCKFSPSDRAVGSIMNCDPRHVSYVVRHASENIDRLALKCYSDFHEDIPCHGKPEQKKGDE